MLLNSGNKVQLFNYKTSYSTNDLIQFVRQTQIIFIITLEATCFDLIYRSSSGLHTMEYSNATQPNLSF
jgi:hypothetical protein